MDPQTVIDLGRQAVLTVVVLGAPVLFVAALVGIVVGFLQAITQIHDPAILFVARLIAVLAVLAIGLPWLAEHCAGYSREVFEHIPVTLSADESL
jgi:flagellar biosynthetic protein FliQ